MKPMLDVLDFLEADDIEALLVNLQPPYTNGRFVSACARRFGRRDCEGRLEDCECGGGAQRTRAIRPPPQTADLTKYLEARVRNADAQALLDQIKAPAAAPYRPSGAPLVRFKDFVKRKALAALAYNARVIDQEEAKYADTSAESPAWAKAALGRPPDVRNRPRSAGGGRSDDAKARAYSEPLGSIVGAPGSEPESGSRPDSPVDRALRYRDEHPEMGGGGLGGARSGGLLGAGGASGSDTPRAALARQVQEQLRRAGHAVSRRPPQTARATRARCCGSSTPSSRATTCGRRSSGRRRSESRRRRRAPTRRAQRVAPPSAGPLTNDDLYRVAQDGHARDAPQGDRRDASARLLADDLPIEKLGAVFRDAWREMRLDDPANADAPAGDSRRGSRRRGAGTSSFSSRSRWGRWPSLWRRS